MFVRWNFTVCWVIHNSFAISSLESPRARAFRIDVSRSVSPAAFAPVGSALPESAVALNTFPSIAWRRAEGRSVGSTPVTGSLKTMEISDMRLTVPGGGVMLTTVGEAVAARARVILREADEIKAIARRAKDPESGTVRVGIFPTLGPYLLPHVVPAIVNRFPRLELILVEEALHQRAADLLADAAVLAIDQVLDLLAVGEGDAAQVADSEQHDEEHGSP